MARKKILEKIAFFIFLVICPFCYAQTQTNSVTVAASIDISKFPQWTKDLRRWEIVAFGTFPFTMFTTTFAMDTWRFAGTGWKDYRYAPWPMKSAGAVDMTNKEYETTMIIAASMSAALAVADLVIVNVKRHKAKQRAESLPVGTTIITKRPWPLTEDAAPAELDSGTAPSGVNPPETSAAGEDGIVPGPEAAQQ